MNKTRKRQPTICTFLHNFIFRCEVKSDIFKNHTLSWCYHYLTGNMYHSRAFWIILAVFQSLPFTYGLENGPELVCDEGWVMSNSAPVCYLPVNESMNWEFASLTCKSVGASLIKVEDETENCEIRNSFENFWIGLSRNAKEVNETVWNGKEVVSDKDGIWDINQPDTDDNKLTCVAANKNHLGRWSYEDCLTKLPFVCKKKAKLKGYFQCANGDIIPPKQICDDENDCSDNSDEMNCSSKCRYLYYGTSGNISYNLYENKKTCQWKIIGPIGTTIQLTVKKGTHLEKNADFITIPETLTNGVTGQITENQIFYSRNNILRIILHSDNSTTGPFEAHWQAENFVESWKLIASSSPQNFPYVRFLPYKQYEWTLTAENQKVLTLQFETVNLDTSSGSLLKFFDGNQPVSVKYNNGEFYVSRSKFVKIVFVSYSVSNQFSVLYYQGCRISAISRQAFNIASPGFDEDSEYEYPNDVYCEWKINKSSNYPASIRFTHFNLKKDSDYITISNGTTDLHVKKGFSGNGTIEKTAVFRSTDGYFMLGFTSDMALTAKGFHAQYSIDCKQETLSQWTKTEPMLEEYTPFGTEITLTCMKGYQFKQEEYNSYSSVRVGCMKGGSWNVTRFPDCQISYCGTPPPINHGYILSSSGVTYNETATYECDEGFTIDNSTISCQADGKWNTKPNCTASGCAKFVERSYLTYKVTDGEFGKYGNVLEFSCDPGYQINGSLRIYCQTRGWSHNPPMCTEITCPVPNVTEGYINSNSGILFNKTTTLQCNDGYIVNGTTSKIQKLTCGSDGTFYDPKGEKSDLLCIDIDECKSNLNSCKPNQTCVNNIGSYTCPCKDGYKAESDPNKNCINIDECKQNNGGCSQNCTDEIPGYSCSCITGFELYMYAGFNNISLAKGENGKREGDVYYINHTCVRKQCPQPFSPKNGIVLSQRNMFYYEDTVKYMCNHGYKMNSSSSSRTCGSDGKWDSEPPSCEVATCKTQLIESDNNIKRIIPGSGVEINYGEESIIECRYGNKLINRTQYCGYTGSDTYGLLGDSSGCPVINCEQPVAIPGSSFSMPTNTTYRGAFNFECQTGFIREGFSTQWSFEVLCEENGRWGWGNLTCTGDKCLDPGTPGGAYQVVTSYEVGELLYFKCSRNGYQPVPPEPFLCYIYNGTVKWNNTELPACKDVTAPVFSNCSSTSTYVDYMEQVSYIVPTSTDNSGVVKNTSVFPSYMKPNTVIKQDTNVTYYAEDYAGNKAMCTIHIKIKQRQVPTLQCASGPVAVKIQNNSFINSLIPKASLVNSVSNGSTLNISNAMNFTSLSEPPKEIKITAMDIYGTATSCSVLAFPLASTCFEEAFPTTAFSNRTCTPDTNGSLTCSVTCNDGYIFYDGKQTQTYQCMMANSPQTYQLLTWTPRSSPNDCLSYAELVYRVEFEVTYSISGSPGYKCILDHDSKLKSVEFRNTLAAQLTNKCSTILNVTNITVEDTVSRKSEGFTIISKLVSVIPSANEKFQQDYCVHTLKFEILSGRLNSYLGYNSPLKCNETTTTASLTSANISRSGYLCSSGNIAKSTYLGTKCVLCPRGSYFHHDSCVDCPEGEYQDVAGQLQCKTCVVGKNPSIDKTTCIDLCPKGFINATHGQVPFCVPCPEDTYWSNSTYCEACPNGYKTFLTGAKNESDCIAPCGEGNYSTTGYEPCLPCPLNYYQDKTGQKTCTACKTNEITENTGTSNSSFCINQIPVWCSSSETHCSGNGVCSVCGHIKCCSCNDGYKGDNCEIEDNPCDAKPCFNGGTCLKTGVNTYNCSCPVVFTGDQCETDAIDSCTNNTDCGSYGMCQDGLGTFVDGEVQERSSFKCLCQKDGDFTQNNRCEKITDLCSHNPCENGGKCQSYGGIRRHCECLPGYTGENCSTNIDECEIHPNGCLYDGQCKDSVNTYTCTCKTGFHGDHCQTAPDFCKTDGCTTGLCYSNYDNYTSVCVCEKPYQLDTNGKCVLIDSCMACQNGTCKNGECECQAGYEGSLCQHDIDDCKKELCKNGAKCIDRHNSVECECKPGYEGLFCDKDIDDCVDSCENATTVRCEDKVTDFKCVCKNGFTGKNCSEEINECTSYPCKHGSECIDQVGDYLCNCTAGWTGKDCETQINYCQNGPCQNRGNCYNLIDGYFCKCKPGTRGDTCNVSPKVCNVTTPCTSNGVCWDSEGTAQCNCTGNYTGTSCNLIKDNCKEDVCNNGGTCKTIDLGFKCECSEGYSGTTCEVYTDPCSDGNKCHNTAMCKSENSKYICICAQGKTLTEKGCKDIDEDWDMFFDSNVGGTGALSLTPFMLWSQEITVAFWTIYKVKDDQIEPTLIQILNSSIANPHNYPIYMEDLSNLTIFKVTNDSVYTSNGTLETRVMLDKSIGDGRWHHVAVTWKSSGQLHISVDAIQKISTSVTSSGFPKYAQLLIGQNLNGRLSRVTVWQTALSYSDVVLAMGNLNYKPQGTLAQGWTNYMLSEGSERKYPSKVKQMVCDLGLKDTSCAVKYKDKPVVVKCPSDQEKYSVTRLTKVEQLILGSDIVFNSSYSFDIKDNFPSDRYFGYGAKSYTAFAIDEYGNIADCTVRVVIKRSSACNITSSVDYRPPFYCDGLSGSICDMQCKNDTKFLSQPVPKIIRCGNLGTYYTESVCENKPYNVDVNDFVLPSCGGVGIMKRRIELKLQYRFLVECTSNFEASLENDIKTTFNSQVSDWAGICTDVKSICNTVTVAATCSQNMVADVIVKVNELSDRISRGGDVYTPKEAFRVLVFIEQKFFYPNIGASVLLNDSVQIEEFESCGPGYAIVGSNCVQCPAGSYYNSSTYRCTFCGIGEYQNQDGQSSCTSCGGIKTTLKLGSSKSSDCVDKCLPGTYYEKNRSKCEQCPLHHYQDKEGKAYCLGCPVGKKTSEKGSNSSADCYVDCIAGTELKPDGSCKSCPRGYYRSLQDDKCQICPNTTFTTETNGTTSKEFCRIRICYAGNYRNANTNECQPCPIGQYQPEDLQVSCKSCDPSYSTKDKGNVNKTSCIFYCKPGEEVESASEKKCRKCARGKYKDNTGNSKFDMCTSCPEGNTTVGEGSMSLSDCRITYCRAGTFRNAATNKCFNCPKGQYTEKDLQEKCESCEMNYFTRNEGSDNKTDCEAFCTAGKQYNIGTKQCEPCPNGTYNNGNDTMKFESCAQCPENYTTPDSGSIAEANCSLLNCDPGYKISGESCIPCGFGFYNSKRHQTHCMACTTNTNTSTEIATNATDCQLYCQPGMSGTIRCEKCENGKIKPYAGLDACTDCLGNYTSNANRTKCDVLFCDKGFYYNATGPTCLPCDKGFYKDKRGNEPTCNKCAIGSTTAGIGTDDSTKCNQTFCIEGKYYNASSPEKCLPCLVGTYKDFVGNNETCLTCGINLTTTDKGAKAQSECSIIVCEAGQRRTGSKTCVDCEPGFYQPERGKTVCKSCEGGKITLNSRSKSIDDCVPLCKAGEEYVAATKNCSLCSFGYFKKEVGNNVGCTKCPQALKTTKTEGSISSKQCTEDICGAGTKRVSNQGCVPCPRGEYQEEQDKTSCKPCGSNYTTVNTGTITNEDCILDCPDGQSYSYSTRTCRNCDNGWYTDKNRYCCKCIQCPDGMQRTAYAGSNICIPSTSTSTMQPERGKRVLMINYTFQIRLNCENADVIRSFKDLLINIIIRRLVSLRLTYTALCKNPSCTDRKSNLRITSVNCGGRSYIISKKRSTEETVKFDVEIPEVEETVKDNAGTGVKTTDLLVEDFNANKNLYKQENVTEFKPTEISQGEFVKFCDAGDVLDTTSNTCKPCPKGTYFESSLMRCIGCQQNKYQDKEAQLTCKNCTGIKKYTINVNSTSVSSCVTECEINRGYCQNGGTCNSDEYSVSCSCTDRYGGDHCQSFKEPVGNTMAIVGGAIGGGAALLIIVLLIVGICAYYRSPRDAYYKRDEGRVYEYDEDVYRNPLFNNRFNMFPPQLNQSFVMDDYSGDDAVYNPYSKNPGRPTGIDEDHSEFRWKPTS